MLGIYGQTVNNGFCSVNYETTGSGTNLEVFLSNCDIIFNLIKCSFLYPFNVHEVLNASVGTMVDNGLGFDRANAKEAFQFFLTG